MEEHEVEGLINEQHQKQALYCEEHFMSNEKATKGAWAACIVLIAIIGSFGGWALTESNAQARTEVKTEQNTKDISSLQTMQHAMDTCVILLKGMKK